MAARGASARNNSGQNLNPHPNPVNATSVTSVTPASDCMTQLQVWANKAQGPEKAMREDVLSRLRATILFPSSELDLSLFNPLVIQALDEDAMVLLARQCANANPPVASIKLPRGMSRVPDWIALFKGLTALDLPEFNGNAAGELARIGQFLPSLQPGSMYKETHQQTRKTDWNAVYLQCHSELERSNLYFALFIARLLDAVNRGQGELDLTSISPKVLMAADDLAGPIAQLLESAAGTGRGGITSIKFPPDMAPLPRWFTACRGLAECKIYRAESPQENLPPPPLPKTRTAHPLDTKVQEWVDNAQGDERQEREAVGTCLQLCLSRASGELDLSGCAPRTVDAIDQTLMRDIAASLDAQKTPVTTVTLPERMPVLPVWLQHLRGTTSLVAQNFKGDAYLAGRWAMAVLPQVRTIDIRQTDWVSIHDASGAVLRKVAAAKPELGPLVSRILDAANPGNGALDLSGVAPDLLMTTDITAQTIGQLQASALETGRKPVTWLKLPAGMTGVPDWLKGCKQLTHLLMPGFAGSWIDVSDLKQLRLINLGTPTHPQLTVSSTAECDIHADAGRFERTTATARRDGAAGSLPCGLLAWESSVPPVEQRKRHAVARFLRDFIATPHRRLDLSECGANAIQALDEALMAKVVELSKHVVTRIKLPPYMHRLPNWLNGFDQLESVIANDYLGDPPASGSAMAKHKKLLAPGDKVLLDWEGNREALVKIGQHRRELATPVELILQAAVSADGVLDLSRVQASDVVTLDIHAAAVQKLITSAMVTGRGEITSVILPENMMAIPDWLATCTELTHLGMQGFSNRALDVSRFSKLRSLDLRGTDASRLLVAAPAGCKPTFDAGDINLRDLTLVQPETVTHHSNNLNNIVKVDGEEVACEQLSEWQLDQWSRGELEPQAFLDTVPNVRRLLAPFIETLPAEASMRNYTAHHLVCEAQFPAFVMKTAEKLAVGGSCLFYVALPTHTMAAKVIKSAQGAIVKFREPNRTSHIQVSKYPASDAQPFIGWETVHHKLPEFINKKSGDSDGKHLTFYEHRPPNSSGTRAPKTCSTDFAGPVKLWPRRTLIQACRDDIPQLLEAVLNNVSSGETTLAKLGRMVKFGKGTVFAHLWLSGRVSKTLPLMGEICELLVRKKEITAKELAGLMRGNVTMTRLAQTDSDTHAEFKKFIAKLKSAGALPPDFA